MSVKSNQNNKHYIKENGKNLSSESVDDLFSEMRKELDANKPKNAIQFLKDYLQKKLNCEKNGTNFVNENKQKKSAFRNTAGEKLIALDIGGSLCKICVFEYSEESIMNKQNFDFKEAFDFENQIWSDKELTFEYNGGKFHFHKFLTHELNKTIKNMHDQGLLKSGDKISATGGGAHKFSSLMLDSYGIVLEKKDELESMFEGLNFVLENRRRECYFFTNPSVIEDTAVDFMDLGDVIYPYILVNIGSGVSIIRVDSRNKFERVSGSFIGGGTFYGLCRLLATKIKNYNELATEALKGDSSKVNMTVSDIYGGDYSKFGLKGSIVASAFGKLISKDDPWEDLSPGDIAISLVNMIGINIAQLAYSCAKVNCIERILFVGNFLRENKLTQNAVSFSVDYWSKGVTKALFLEHEGFFGSIGAFITKFEQE